MVAAKTLVDTRRVRVMVLEATDRLGGKLQTNTVGGMTIEGGADSFLVREPWALDLCRSLDLEEELVPPAEYGALVWTRTGLRALPAGFLRGFPPSVRAAFGAEALSFWGALRTIGDLVLPGPLQGPDVSLGRFVQRRFGRELLENLVDPVLAGTRAGRPEEISLQAAAPEIDRVARNHRSVMRGLKKMRAGGLLETGAPPFMTLRSGMQTLVDALVRRLGDADVHLRTPVQGIDRDAAGIGVITDDSRIVADGIVLSVPAFAAAELLRDISPDASASIGTIEYASIAGITLVFGKQLPLPSGSGMLVPRSTGRSISACTWFSKKWPHHARDGQTSIRCFIGRAGRDVLLGRTDTELIDTALEDLRESIGIDEPPTDASVTRWDRSLPQYKVGHTAVVERAVSALRDLPIELAGAGFRGSGIPDCINQATAAAGRLLQRL